MKTWSWSWNWTSVCIHDYSLSFHPVSCLLKKFSGRWAGIQEIKRLFQLKEWRIQLYDNGFQDDEIKNHDDETQFHDDETQYHDDEIQYHDDENQYHDDEN